MSGGILYPRVGCPGGDILGGTFYPTTPASYMQRNVYLVVYTS